MVPHHPGAGRLVAEEFVPLRLKIAAMVPRREGASKRFKNAPSPHRLMLRWCRTGVTEKPGGAPLDFYDFKSDLRWCRSRMVLMRRGTAAVSITQL
ncbi:hypothetical protein ACFRAR_12325 [Kitasatospora sp. NPDC056651]|uniref:hypothetical protein n=1 Tax=Kitasatospora sp. NPDC056651 TaxID=3345892 RepID=UPI0036AB2FAD